MTIETGECKEVHEGSGAEFEGKSVQGLVHQEDGRRSGECNGIARREAEYVSDVARDDVDGSYVFVNGDSDGLCEKDLEVDDKVDLARSQRDERSVESDSFSERDLGENSKVEIRFSNTEGCEAERSALTQIAAPELEERTSECKESSDHNEEKGDLVPSVEEAHSQKEKVELSLENDHNRKESDAPNLDFDVETPNIQKETCVYETIGEHSVPDPVTVIENVSCEEHGCGDSLGDTVGDHDGSNTEILVNGKVEDQGDCESLTATPSDIKDKDSEHAVSGIAESASLSLVNGKEMSSFNSEEKIPEEEQSEIVVSVTHESESLPPVDEGTLASSGAEDNPAEEQEIVATERNETESVPLGDEEIVASNGTEDYPVAKQATIVVTERGRLESLPLADEVTTSNGAEDNPAGQAEVEITERSGSETLALVNKEELVALNSAEEIPPVEQFAQSRLEPDSETQSVMELADKSQENSETISVATVDEVKTEADNSNSSQESSERMPSCLVKQPAAEDETTEVLVENPKSSSICPAGDEGLVKEVISFGDTEKFGLEVGNESAESMEDVSGCSANDTDSRTVNEEIAIEHKVYPCPPVNGIEPETEEMIDPLKNQDHISAFPEVETRLEETGEILCVVPGNNTTPMADEETVEDACAIPDNDATPIAEEESGENASAIPANDAKPIIEEDGEENISSIPAGDVHKTPITEGNALFVETDEDAPRCDVGDVKLEHEVGSGPVEQGESMTDSVEECQSANKDVSDKVASAEDNDNERGPENETLVAPTDDPGSLSLPGQKVDIDVKNLPIFMVRVPRFSDDKLKMQILHAQQEVDEKTGSRDSIRVAMQKQKSVCAEYWRKIEDARKEERAARDAVASKRQEIDSIQAILSKLKNATSISDIDNRIHKLQHKINHETNTLKEEKSLIREMNQLKQSREHLSSSLASEKELQEAFEKQEEMETRLKHLKDELDTLRKETLRAEGNTKDAKARYENQCECLRDLQTQFKAADDLRQEAYTNLRNLKKESYLKNEHFYSYKDDLKVATNHAFSGDREALRTHCTNQVEKLMELWNKNDEFRHQYVKANLPSTLRRFRTLDGRSLGPDEQPAIIHSPTEQKENVISTQVSKNIAPALTPERKQEKAEAPLSAAKLNSADAPALPQKGHQPAQKPKKVTKPAAPREVAPTRESDKEEAEKEAKRTMEEEEQARKAAELARKAEELARKEEELRKEKEAAELKEQLRLEQIAKAKEAEERKKRKAEKAQAKAELRAQKEAELKEKKREKKEKKKERKSTATSAENVAVAEVAAPAAEVPQESVQEQPEKTATSTTAAPSKRPSRPRAVATKEYNKLKPLPPPLRNRGKRKMQTWMWAILTALVVLGLFVAGNYVSFNGFGLRNFSF